MPDLACVIHCHSIYSDGTGTVPQIAAATARAGADVVLLTDHDSLEAKRRGEEGWRDGVLVCVGLEVSPKRQNHYLAFGLDQEIDHAGLSPAQICAAVSQAGGFGFLAHPFSRGSPRFRRAGEGMPWRDLECDGYTGIELWSMVTDTGEQLESMAEVVRFVAAPGRVLERPPERNLTEWDRLGARRRVVGIGGIDAHQFGLRVAGRVPLRLMGYHRSFRHLRTHVLLERPLTGDGPHDRDAVYGALREGRCYLARDSLAPAGGFAFEAQGTRMGEEVQAGPLELLARTPRPAVMSLLRDGAPVASAHGRELRHTVEEPGVYRVEASLHAHGRERTWIVSNPVYLR
jgi:hypothetical protein